MTKNEITLKVHAAIHDVVKTDHTLTGSTHLRDNLGMDSLDEMAFALTLEPIFGIDLSDADLLVTIGEVVEILEARL